MATCVYRCSRFTPLSFYLSSHRRLETMGEVVQDFDTYAQAAKNACDVLGKINPVKIEPYKG